MKQQPRKIVIIGAGAVGVTYCYALMQHGLADEIVLIDLDHDRVAGEIMDLSHGLPFVQPVRIRAGDYSDCADAALIVLTAGAKQKPNQSRRELVQQNAKIVVSICQQIKRYANDAILLVVTNPVDVLTYIAINQLGWPKPCVIGSGTVLDSSRFRYMISQHCQIDPRNVHAYILGEHGDSEVAAWSMTHIAGVPITDYCPGCQRCDFRETHRNIAQKVRDSAYHIIDYKGATYYAIGLSLVRISEAILRDEHSVLTVSTLLNGEYGLKDICLSVPCILDRTGLVSIIEAKLAADEQKALQASAQVLRNNLADIHL
ncbi:MAG: L-lactate dehydrogenase [Sedimentisphaerales bacterium]|nr:L-lactate dehydrogenase [Sedimentisphaerales bacterium]